MKKVITQTVKRRLSSICCEWTVWICFDCHIWYISTYVYMYLSRHLFIELRGSRRMGPWTTYVCWYPFTTNLYL